MTLSTWQDWIAWAGVVLPLGGFAWSAVVYALAKREENKRAHYMRFFELAEQLGRQDFSIAAKMAAVFEMRKFPEYREVIVRICRDVSVEGPSAEPLKREMEMTAEILGGQR